MTARVRKIFGGIGLLAFLAAYVWAATAISDRLPDKGAIKMIFFAVAGLLWGVPILPLISWMNRGR
ncbi:MAG TPA: DUF2842 domain-containing protein [Phenylobacterium sp.]|nr:DUF2842 domain-containing protein [Phenylobacterium sp.]